MHKPHYFESGCIESLKKIRVEVKVSKRGSPNCEREQVKPWRENVRIDEVKPHEVSTDTHVE